MNSPTAQHGVRVGSGRGLGEAVLRTAAIVVLRAALWSGIGGAAMTAVALMRSDPAFRLGLHETTTWFSLFWALAFVPCLAMEFWVRHLLVELGSGPRNARELREGLSGEGGARVDEAEKDSPEPRTPAQESEPND